MDNGLTEENEVKSPCDNRATVLPGRRSRIPLPVASSASQNRAPRERDLVPRSAKSQDFLRAISPVNTGRESRRESPKDLLSADSPARQGRDTGRQSSQKTSKLPVPRCAKRSSESRAVIDDLTISKAASKSSRDPGKLNQISAKKTSISTSDKRHPLSNVEGPKHKKTLQNKDPTKKWVPIFGKCVPVGDHTKKPLPAVGKQSKIPNHAHTSTNKVENKQPVERNTRRDIVKQRDGNTTKLSQVKKPLNELNGRKPLPAIGATVPKKNEAPKSRVPEMAPQKSNQDLPSAQTATPDIRDNLSKGPIPAIAKRTVPETKAVKKIRPKAEQYKNDGANKEAQPDSSGKEAGQSCTVQAKLKRHQAGMEAWRTIAMKKMNNNLSPSDDLRRHLQIKYTQIRQLLRSCLIRLKAEETPLKDVYRHGPAPRENPTRRLEAELLAGKPQPQPLKAVHPEGGDKDDDGKPKPHPLKAVQPEGGDMDDDRKPSPKPLKAVHPEGGDKDDDRKPKPQPLKAIHPEGEDSDDSGKPKPQQLKAVHPAEGGDKDGSWKPKPQPLEAIHPEGSNKDDGGETQLQSLKAIHPAEGEAMDNDGKHQPLLHKASHPDCGDRDGGGAEMQGATEADIAALRKDPDFVAMAKSLKKSINKVDMGATLKDDLSSAVQELMTTWQVDHEELCHIIRAVAASSSAASSSPRGTLDKNDSGAFKDNRTLVNNHKAQMTKRHKKKGREPAPLNLPEQNDRPFTPCLSVTSSEWADMNKTSKKDILKVKKYSLRMNRLATWILKYKVDRYAVESSSSCESLASIVDTEDDGDSDAESIGLSITASDEYVLERSSSYYLIRDSKKAKKQPARGKQDKGKCDVDKKKSGLGASQTKKRTSVDDPKAENRQKTKINYDKRRSKLDEIKKKTSPNDSKATSRGCKGMTDISYNTRGSCLNKPKEKSSADEPKPKSNERGNHKGDEYFKGDQSKERSLTNDQREDSREEDNPYLDKQGSKENRPKERTLSNDQRADGREKDNQYLDKQGSKEDGPKERKLTNDQRADGREKDNLCLDKQGSKEDGPKERTLTNDQRAEDREKDNQYLDKQGSKEDDPKERTLTNDQRADGREKDNLCLDKQGSKEDNPKERTLTNDQRADGRENDNLCLDKQGSKEDEPKERTLTNGQRAEGREKDNLCLDKQGSKEDDPKERTLTNNQRADGREKDNLCLDKQGSKEDDPKERSSSNDQRADSQEKVNLCLDKQCSKVDEQSTIASKYEITSAGRKPSIDELRVASAAKKITHVDTRGSPQVELKREMLTPASRSSPSRENNSTNSNTRRSGIDQSTLRKSSADGLVEGGGGTGNKLCDKQNMSTRRSEKNSSDDGSKPSSRISDVTYTDEPGSGRDDPEKRTSSPAGVKRSPRSETDNMKRDKLDSVPGASKRRKPSADVSRAGSTKTANANRDKRVSVVNISETGETSANDAKANRRNKDNVLDRLGSETSEPKMDRPTAESSVIGLKEKHCIEIHEESVSTKEDGVKMSKKINPVVKPEITKKKKKTNMIPVRHTKKSSQMIELNKHWQTTYMETSRIKEFYIGSQSRVDYPGCDTSRSVFSSRAVSRVSSVDAEIPCQPQQRKRRAVKHEPGSDEVNRRQKSKLKDKERPFAGQTYINEENIRTGTTEDRKSRNDFGKGDRVKLPPIIKQVDGQVDIKAGRVSRVSASSDASGQICQGEKGRAVEMKGYSILPAIEDGKQRATSARSKQVPHSSKRPISLPAIGPT